jgi:hypothetical protein
MPSSFSINKYFATKRDRLVFVPIVTYGLFFPEVITKSRVCLTADDIVKSRKYCSSNIFYSVMFITVKEVHCFLEFRVSYVMLAILI